jgi:CBS-domain-containing membrane protein
MPQEGYGMTVKAILSLKAGDVATLEPTASLATAAIELAEHRIGALVVMDCAHRVAGIVRA